MNKELTEKLRKTTDEEREIIKNGKVDLNGYTGKLFQNDPSELARKRCRSARGDYDSVDILKIVGGHLHIVKNDPAALDTGLNGRL